MSRGPVRRREDLEILPKEDSFVFQAKMWEDRDLEGIHFHCLEDIEITSRIYSAGAQG